MTTTIPNLLAELEAAVRHLGDTRRDYIATVGPGRYRWPWSPTERAYVQLTADRPASVVASVLCRPVAAIEDERLRQQGRAAA